MAAANRSRRRRRRERHLAALSSAAAALLAAHGLLCGVGLAEAASRKRTAAATAPPPPPPAPEDNAVEPADGGERPPPPLPPPPAFLSPSVRDYLELGKAIPGRPGTDYPLLGAVPYTNFYCDEQPYPGFFADAEARCQAWHYCDLDGRQATFLCPNGTVFSQLVLACDWWFNVRCDLARKLYPINGRLYGRPRTADPARQHRTITKKLLEEIFNDDLLDDYA